MRTQMRKLVRSRHRMSPIGLFFGLANRANLGDLPDKHRKMRYLDDAQFFMV